MVVTSVTHHQEGIMDRSIGLSVLRRLLVVAGLGLVGASTPAFALEPCGTGMYPFPYTDVGSVGDPFCPGIMEAYVTGVSKGTTPTTFSPNNTVTRVQMTTFLQRSLDQGLARTSRRAALNQWWTPQTTDAMQVVVVGGTPFYCAADGADIWTSNGSQVVQVQANTGRVLGTWTGAASSADISIAAGKVFVPGFTSPGNLYVIDPTQTPGAVTMAASNLGNDPVGIAFDGTHLWTANFSGSVSIITPQAATPYPVTTVTTGFSQPLGILYDGAHIWVTDSGAGTLLKLDASGGITQTVSVGSSPQFPVFDGANIWVPNSADDSITVVQASTGSVVATITANLSNLLSGPFEASFDGERILVTNFSGHSVTLFKAADLSFIANVTTGGSTAPHGACDDGVNFWVTLNNAGELLRF
jgi:DNA-binding beta-propeller fold protein YncE